MKILQSIGVGLILVGVRGVRVPPRSKVGEGTVPHFEALQEAIF